jgi:NTP pyrophosphatase (non-canonical NTP hydrolase)
MKNIVDELRDRAYCGKGVDSLCERAASEIERLRWADKKNKNVIDRLMKLIPPPVKKGSKQMTFAELEDAVKQWARDRKIIPNSTPKMQLLKTMSELGELADATAKADGEGIVDGIGDVLVTLIIYAELSGVTLAECLNEAYLTIKDRRGTLTPEGIFVKDGG